MTQPPSGLATSQQVAAYLGHGSDDSNDRDQTLRRWRMEGRGPRWLKVGGRIRYRWADVERWLAEQEHEPEHATPAPRRRSTRRRAS
jgi:hypothetical protein